MKVLVTGATGFIGAHLATRLAAAGHEVRALVRQAPERTLPAGVLPVCGDLTQPASLAEAALGVEAVFHLAAQRDGWGVPAQVYRAVNVDGTRHLLAAAEGAGVRCFVYCSSVGVARYAGRLDASETLPYAASSSQVAYHETKTEAERMTLAAAQAGRLPALVVRPVISYGPGDKTGMITQLLLRIARGGFVRIGSGRNHVDLAYVDDVVTGMLQAAVAGRPGEVYILSGPGPCAMMDVLAMASQALGRPRPRGPYLPAGLARGLALGVEAAATLANRRPPVTHDAVDTFTVDRGFSHAKAAAELGYRPQIALADGLRRTVAWLRGAGLL